MGEDSDIETGDHERHLEWTDFGMIKVLEKSATAVLSCTLAFLILEGLCSSLVVGGDLLSAWRALWTTSVVHTQFDPELGWLNIPNFGKKDYYNPGVYIKTNSRGFRNQEEFDVHIPSNRLRIVCVGDSFTFGVGVDNDHSWCQQLASTDHRLQTVNMGVGGYGVDQMYLWYLREGARVDHDVLILAATPEAFWRIPFKRSGGYGKPVLQVRGNQLVAANVPVRKASRFVRWMHLNARDAVFELRTVTVLQWILNNLQPARASGSDRAAESQRAVIARIIASLQAINKQKNSVLFLVYMPTLEEYYSWDSPQRWRGLLRDEAAKQGIPFIDFFEDIQKLALSEVQRLFIPPNVLGAGHLSDYGNEYVARKLYRFVADNPEISAKLARLR